MSMIQTGTIELDSRNPSAVQGGNISTFTPVNFPTPFPEGSKVIVVPMSQTFNGPDTIDLRLADITTEGFKIRMNEVVVYNNGSTRALSDGTHATETIGWIAFTA